jgi:F-type H+-transporting ATPase subunit epsilon
VSFQCDIVTPDSQPFAGTVESVVLPAHDGQVGILTGRAPLLVKLGTGTLTTRIGGTEKHFQVDRGVAQMKDNKLTVLTEAATEATAASTSDAA